ncbi:thioredoxin [Ramlibacter tataouinensis]|uniref:Thioredoxin n=1 Tax=Ramlibacter tataouinensis (strain ATCC BAA-407 / DSM 14655 / LMG 21543 / TTB310) TaxID=365046 RepID=F5Y224_RAMTT|nr:thioredoxin [Ramlibacter tataouinensis]AEG94792.1 thioredoxin-like protein [Ramlibacter tataouinensis TTB310]
MIDVTLENFETEVIAASMNQPVLVDFWAPWSGPCKVIGPILEKLERDYAGRFKLVKIDSDQEQQLAAAFGIRSIPTVILLMGGQPVDGFMGALPEGQVRQFLDKHLPAAAEEEAQEEAPFEDTAPADAGAQLEKLQHAVATDPANDDARFEYVKALLLAGRSDDAKVAFAPVIAKTAAVRRLDSLQRLMDAMDVAAGLPDAQRAAADFEAKIAANKRDFEARFGKARLLMAQQRWTAAMDELLEILMRDKAWNEDLARKTYIAILDIIEPPRPKVAEGQIPPDDPTVATYRRRLSSVVLS